MKNVPNLNKYKIIILHDIQKCFKQKLSYHFESINQCTYHTLVSYRVYVIQKILLLLMWRCSVFMHFGVVLKLHVIPILLKVKQKETDIKKSGDGQLNYHWWHLVVRFRNVSMRFIAVAVWLRLILDLNFRSYFINWRIPKKSISAKEDHNRFLFGEITCRFHGWFFNTNKLKLEHWVWS